MNPTKRKREQDEIETNPLFVAGTRGLERLKWDYLGGQEVAAQLKEQGL